MQPNMLQQNSLLIPDVTELAVLGLAADVRTIKGLAASVTERVVIADVAECTVKGLAADTTE